VYIEPADHFVDIGEQTGDRLGHRATDPSNRW
jgi:hypothetical protein